MTGFEPVTFCTQNKRATKLRYIPLNRLAGGQLDRDPVTTFLPRPTCTRSWDAHWLGPGITCGLERLTPQALAGLLVPSILTRSTFVIE